MGGGPGGQSGGTMSLQRQVTFWLAALALFGAVLWLLSPVLMPFIAGMALAYLLDPLTRQVERSLRVQRPFRAEPVFRREPLPFAPALDDFFAGREQ